MESGLIRSVYDLDKQPEELLGRRDFLKKAGVVGLALAGGAAGLSGCGASLPIKILGRDFEKYDFDAIARRYENNPIKINSIDDFALLGEELGWMRLCEWTEKTIIPLFGKNPLKGNKDTMKENSDIYFLARGTNSPEEWFFAEYTGRIHYPHYALAILANRFRSEKDCLEAGEVRKKIYEKINIPGHKSRTFSKSNFMVGVSAGDFLSEAHKQDVLARMNLYQRKRGLDLVVGNY